MLTEHASSLQPQGTSNARSSPEPDTHLRKPKFTPPAYACDSHCHVFGPADIFPFVSNRTYTPPDAPAKALFAMHQTIGVTRAVVVQATCHGTDHAAMLDTIAGSSGNYCGVAIVDDNFTDTALEILHQGGVRGARFSFIKHVGEIPEIATVRRIAARIASLGWHLDFLMNATDIDEHYNMLKLLPVPFVIDHMGRVRAEHGIDQPSFRTLLDLMDLEHAWVKISCADRTSNAGHPFTDALPFATALARKAPDRVLWGTDWPHPNIMGPVPNDCELIDLIPSVAPDEKARQQILVENPARLYGFSEKPCLERN